MSPTDIPTIQPLVVEDPTNNNTHRTRKLAKTIFVRVALPVAAVAVVVFVVKKLEASDLETALTITE